jgi:hypothetical protein
MHTEELRTVPQDLCCVGLYENTSDLKQKTYSSLGES